LLGERADSSLHANEATPMLAEKFILLMEMLKNHASPDGAPRVVSASPHVPVKLPAASPITAH
jgi:hypothetical protein